MTYFDMGMPRPRRAFGKIGHYGVHILIAAIVASIVLVLRPLPADQPAAAIVPLTLLAVVIGSWPLMRSHDRHLCENCMAAMPLNAEETSARFRRRFQVAHIFADRRLAVAYLLGLIVSGLVLLGGAVPQPAGQWLWAAIQSSMIYLVLSYSTHRTLQPWCPQCKGGGDGDRADAPDPLPSGSYSG